MILIALLFKPAQPQPLTPLTPQWKDKARGRAEEIARLEDKAARLAAQLAAAQAEGGALREAMERMKGERDAAAAATPGVDAQKASRARS